MSQFRNSPYWEWLAHSASSQVKREVEQMEKSKRSSFVSTQEVIARRYGRQEKC